MTIQAQILKLLKPLAKDRGVSVLFTTHDLGTAYEICDEITVMYAGQEVESAPVDEFFANPRHPYTARLLESLPNPAREMREIGGEIPNLVFPPTGCRFHPRCAQRERRLLARRDLRASGTRQMVRCFHPSAAPAGGGHVSAHGAAAAGRASCGAISRCATCSGLRSGTMKALDGVSFDVRAGETFGIVGESGCGKSTLGKALAGIHAPSAGRIVFEGAEISDLQGAARAARRPTPAIYPPGPGQCARSALDHRPLARRAARDAHRAKPVRARCAQPGDLGRRRAARRASRSLSRTSFRVASSAASGLPAF